MELDLEKLSLEEKKLWDDSCWIPSASGLPLGLPYEFRCLHEEEHRHRLLLCGIRLLYFCILSVSSGRYIHLIVHLRKLSTSKRERNQRDEYARDDECEQIRIGSELHHHSTAGSIYKSRQCGSRSVYIPLVYQEWRRSLVDSISNTELSIPPRDHPSFKCHYIQTVRRFNP